MTPGHRRVGGREGSALLCRVPTGQRPVHHVAGGPADPSRCPAGLEAVAPQAASGQPPRTWGTARVLEGTAASPRRFWADGSHGAWVWTLARPSPGHILAACLCLSFLPHPVGLLQGPSVAGLATARCREGTGRGGARSCHRDRTFAWGLRGGVFLGSGVSVPFGRGPRRHSMPGLRSTFWVLFPAVSLRDPSPPTFSVSCDR